MGIFYGIMSVLMGIAAIGCVVDEWKRMWMVKRWIMAILRAIASVGCFTMAYFCFTLPHYGNDATEEDYPEEAVIDTIVRHHNGDTTVTYEYVWKD